MNVFTPAAPPPIGLTLKVLSHLLSYPDADLLCHLDELRLALRDEGVLSASREAELGALIGRLAAGRPLELEANYVELFDRGRSTALHLFEHVHGDSRDRGPAMVDLVKTYEAAGLILAPGELPDHLCIVLEYASTQPPAQARALLGEIAHILQSIFAALLRSRSPYASVVAAVLDLAGERAPAVVLAAALSPAAHGPVDRGPAEEGPEEGGPEEAGLDESWEEPPAFGGCSTQGQSRPGQPQPIRIVKSPNGVRGASA